MNGNLQTNHYTYASLIKEYKIPRSDKRKGVGGKDFSSVLPVGSTKLTFLPPKQSKDFSFVLPNVSTKMKY